MLLALFMVMYAVMRLDNQKLTEFQNKVRQTFGDTQIEYVTKYQANAKIYTVNRDNLEKLLSDSLSKNKSLKLLKSDNGLIIRVNSTLLFDEGSADIKKNGPKTLDEISKVLTKIENPVIIEGHTDSVPIKTDKFPSNWELSTARATNIISYLTRNGKFSPSRLRAVGYGEYMPVADNSLNSGRMLNRRVDIIVLEK